MTAVSAGQDIAKMVIFSVYVVNKAGGLIYQYDNYVPRAEAEKTFSYPLDLVLKHHDEKVVVSFGQRDGIRGNSRTRPELVGSFYALASAHDRLQEPANVMGEKWEDEARDDGPIRAKGLIGLFPFVRLVADKLVPAEPLRSARMKLR